MKKLNQFTLNDGRQLSFSENGSPSGKPVLLMHGTPGSRLECHPDHEVLKNLNINFIVPDRPGYGHSDPAPGRTLLSWANDVAELMDYLKLPACSILGFSGGGRMPWLAPS